MLLVRQYTKGMETTQERYWAKVRKTDSCWLWTAATQRGYGAFGVEGKLVRAHRYAYELLVGAIPDGLVLDHVVCDNPLCVRPDHMRVCSQGENIARSNTKRASAQTHCKRGHEFTSENTYVNPAHGGRVCRVCMNAHQRAYYRRKTAGQ